MASAYSTGQLSKYLRCITLPPQYEPYVQSPQSFPKTEEALTVLFRCQITRFPYDNLSVFKSEKSLVDIKPQSIYTKLIGGESDDSKPTGRGGYCLECNIFFYHVLKGLGFSVYMTGVRSRIRIDGIPQGDYKGWKHMANIVKLATTTTSQEYHVDVAFGGDGPTRPMPLISGQEFQSLGLQEVRLIYDNIPQQTRLERKFWIYQYRNGPDKAWNSLYAFAEFEFFHDDIEVINHFTSWETLTNNELWIVKFIRDGETHGLPITNDEEGFKGLGDGGISVVGKIMFISGSPDVIKLNMGGKSRVINSLMTREARVQGLRKWFGIHI
ncbi:hypothetical protein BDW72DRAFT_208726 [Aspergillus terricola var. indicus]